jgi:non-ribosomal peptide synthetase component F
VLRADFDDDPTFRQLLAQVRETTLEAYDHQDVPFDLVVEAVQPERDLSHTPLFQVMFLLQNNPAQQAQLPGLTLQPVETDTGASPFDLTLGLAEQPDGLAGSVEYNADLFDADTIERLVGHLHLLLEGIVAQPDARVSRLPLLTAAEQHKLLVEWNDTAVPYPLDQCVHHLFEAQVERTPEATAVAYRDQTLTYAQLNARANQLAHYLQTLGVGPDALVGLSLPRTPEMAVALLGILKAGGAYLPLDPDYPAERLALYYSGCSARRHIDD